MDEQMVDLVGAVAAVFFVGAIFAAVALTVAGMWKAFVKAGCPGWGALIPIYNIILMLRIAGRPDIWVLFFLIPGVNFVFQVIVSIDFAKSFGKDALFALGLVFLPVVFFPILGFGSSRYLGPAAGASIAPPTTPGSPQPTR